MCFYWRQNHVIHFYTIQEYCRAKEYCLQTNLFLLIFRDSAENSIDGLSIFWFKKLWLLRHGWYKLEMGDPVETELWLGERERWFFWNPKYTDPKWISWVRERWTNGRSQIEEPRFRLFAGMRGEGGGEQVALTVTVDSFRISGNGSEWSH